VGERSVGASPAKEVEAISLMQPRLCIYVSLKMPS